jgi:uncharacterized membrane protein
MIKAQISLDLAKKEKESHCKAFFFTSLYAILMTTVSVIFKKIAVEGVSNYDFAFCRTCVGTLMMSSFLLWKKSNPYKELPRRHYLKMLIRNQAGTWGIILMFYIMQLIPLTIQMVIW